MMQTNLRNLMFENDNLEDINTILEQGGTILYPTDTIWGIGCDACNPEAIDKIFKLKQRDPSKPFVVLVNSMDMIKQYVHHIHPRVETLLSHHVRPLTVIYDKAKNLPNNTTAENGSIAIRLVQDSFCKNMITRLGRPIIATSANVSNKPFPQNFGEIDFEIIKGVDYVVRLRQEEKTLNNPSVIISISEKGDIHFLRE